MIWIVLAIVLAAAELAWPTLFLAPFAAGAMLGAGLVKLEGELWTARAWDEDEVIEAGRRVHVIEIRGATALVSES